MRLCLLYLARVGPFLHRHRRTHRVAGYPLGDPIPILLLFAQQYRTGHIAPGNKPGHSRTVVEDAMHHVAQTFTRVGAVDPCLNAFGTLDFRLHALFQAWKRTDPPSSPSLNPLPLAVLRQAHHLLSGAPSPTPRLAATGNCLVFAFYLLIRPGEYSGLPRHVTDNLFWLNNLGIWIGQHGLDPLATP
ncbi:hypothetical protein MHU86_1284 [Fragilaria crotonensis]|nr:hypothetical protein MHU86_1284 [Fragilaria crotonensis]